MRIVVTGASGVVGQSVLAFGRQSGHHMLGTSRSYAGPDVQRVTDYRDVPDGDVLIHLAQPANRNTLDDASSKAALALLEELCARPWRRVVYASSTATYGRLAGHVNEEHPASGNDAYTQLKLASEAICLRRSSGLVLRLSNILSDPPARNTVCCDILDQIADDGPIVVRNSGAQLDLLWVADAARGVLSAAAGNVAGVFHLAYGHSVSVMQLAQVALEGAGQAERQISSRIEAPPDPKFSLDVSRARLELGWNPQTDPLTMIAAMAKQRTRALR